MSDLQQTTACFVLRGERNWGKTVIDLPTELQPRLGLHPCLSSGTCALVARNGGGQAGIRPLQLPAYWHSKAQQRKFNSMDFQFENLAATSLTGRPVSSDTLT